MSRSPQFSRRSVLVLPLGALATHPSVSAIAQTAELPPVLFLHGNGDHAGLWQTAIWRFESNGYDRAKLFAFNFTDPMARDDDAIPQLNRSSTADQLREIAVQVEHVLAATKAPRLAMVASSRGGNAVRNYLTTEGGAGKVSHVVLCGTPNHGVFAFDALMGSEFNGRGPFLTRLNAQPDEITAGPAWLTLRSDGMDKYAQPDGRFIGRPGVPTGVNADGAELKGAVNLVLGAVDHRETAFSPRAFREIYKFIAGREPDRIAITPEAPVRISGLVTGNPGGVPTNRPIENALVQVYALSPDNAERQGPALYEGRTGETGAWGPALPPPGAPLEFLVTAEGYPVTHIYRAAFPRSTSVMHLRPGRLLAAAEKEAGAVALFTRPRGYFGRPRDVVLFDGKEPADVKTGVPTDATTTLRLAEATSRPVVGEFNEERVVSRTWPARENHLTIAELTF